MSNPVRIFITHSHTDMDAKKKMISALAVMERNGLIEILHDRDLIGGDDWRDELFNNFVPNSDLLLYLVSFKSMASKNCYKELKIAMEHKIRIVPIILEDCDWKNDRISDFNAYPDDGMPINEWDPESKGWQNAVDGVRKTVQEMRSKADSFEIAFQHGNLMLSLGRLDIAIKAYTDAIDLDPHNANVYNNRGVAYEKNKDLDKAMADYDKSIELQPNPFVYSNRGNAHVAKGDPDKAMVNYDKAIKIHPVCAMAYNNRGLLHTIIGEIKKAIEDFDNAVNNQPNFAIAYSNRGIAYGIIDDVKNAIKNFDDAINIDSNYMPAHYNRGKINNILNKNEESISDYTRAIEIEPDYVDAYYGRGLVYIRQVEFVNAIEDFSKAIELKPDHAGAHFHRAVVGLIIQAWEHARHDLTSARNMGFDIAAAFCGIFRDIENFERLTKVSMPDDIAGMLGSRSE